MPCLLLMYFMEDDVSRRMAAVSGPTKQIGDDSGFDQSDLATVLVSTNQIGGKSRFRPD